MGYIRSLSYICPFLLLLILFLFLLLFFKEFSRNVKTSWVGFGLWIIINYALVKSLEGSLAISV